MKPPKKLFFCCGLAKSGTTLLQRVLDMHPEISCPPEHQFRFLSDALARALTNYDGILEGLDQRLGGHGVEPLTPAVHAKLFRHAVRTMVWHSAGDKPIAGANDNISIIPNFDYYDAVFGSPKFVVIFRNPLDRAVSSWHNNLALAEELKDSRFKDIMEEHGDFAGWARFIAEGFAQAAAFFLKKVRERDNIYLLRYEDLVHHKREVLFGLYRFLHATADDHVVSSVVEGSDFTAMKDSSTRKAFFRSASTIMGGEEITAALRSEIAAATPEATAMGYDLLQQRVLACPLFDLGTSATRQTQAD